jgi:hypothetical protein
MAFREDDDEHARSRTMAPVGNGSKNVGGGVDRDRVKREVDKESLRVL